VSQITDLFIEKEKDISWSDSQEAAFLKIIVLFTSGKTPILRHNDPNQPSLVETDASHFATAGLLLQMFEDGKLHPVSFVSWKLLPAQLNYNMFNKEMPAIIFLLRKRRQFLPGAQYEAIVYSDHQNFTYFKTAVLLYKSQTRSAEELLTFNIHWYFGRVLPI
jgi:hypothetical protein